MQKFNAEYVRGEIFAFADLEDESWIDISKHEFLEITSNDESQMTVESNHLFQIFKKNYFL